MIKKILKGMLVGGAAMTIAASAANAAKIEVNIFGASAQFKFWNAMAPKFLDEQYGCAQADIWATQSDALMDRDAGITICAGDTAYAGKTGMGTEGDTQGATTAGDTIIIRYTSNASYDGVMSVQDDDTFDSDNCSTDGDRYQADPVESDLVAMNDTVNTFPGETLTQLACMDVHVGASDVSAKTFKQESDGWKKGNFTLVTTDPTEQKAVSALNTYILDSDGYKVGSNIINRKIHYPSTVTVDPETDLNYQTDRPIVVPFGFYANTSVVPDNLTRLMAINLFAGNIANWQELDEDYPDMPVVVCHRHAGSGTVATLNAAVFRGTGIFPEKQQDDIIPITGDPLYDAASIYLDTNVLSGAAPTIFFNKGSSDATRCAGYNQGAVSYADSDKCVGGCGGKYGNVKALAYQGIGGDANPTHVMRDEIRSGRHIFWSAQYLYSNESGATDTVIDALVAYAADGDNMPGTNVVNDPTDDTGKALFWASQDEMQWEKINDFSWPTKK